MTMSELLAKIERARKALDEATDKLSEAEEAREEAFFEQRAAEEAFDTLEQERDEREAGEP